MKLIPLGRKWLLRTPVRRAIATRHWPAQYGCPFEIELRIQVCFGLAICFGLRFRRVQREIAFDIPKIRLRLLQVARLPRGRASAGVRGALGAVESRSSAAFLLRCFELILRPAALFTALPPHRRVWDDLVEHIAF